MANRGLCLQVMFLSSLVCWITSTVDLPNTIERVPGSSGGVRCHEVDYDAVYLIDNGTVWQRRCHTCACIDGEIVCLGPQCQLEYDPTFEYTCTQWSSDGCCCEHEGCLIEGEHVDMGAWYRSPDHPCEFCQCSLGSRSCTFNYGCQDDDASLDETSNH